MTTTAVISQMTPGRPDDAISAPTMKGEITVLSKEDYARWADEASKNSARLFDENDKDAHWGWDWKGN